jgi:hypothetical protein
MTGTQARTRPEKNFVGSSHHFVTLEKKATTQISRALTTAHATMVAFLRRWLTRARPGLAPRAPMFVTRTRDDVVRRSVAGAAHMVFLCELGPADFRDLRSLGDRDGTTEIRFFVKEVPVDDTLPSTENRQGGESSASDAFVELVQEGVVMSRVLEHLPGSADVARLRAVCREVRDAVDATGRELKEKSAEEAVEAGCLDTVRRMILGGRLSDKKYLCHTAARSGQLKELKLLRAAGCPWDELTCAIAAAGGHLEALKWARENDCRWDEQTCANAAAGGHLEILKWARENGCPWDEYTCSWAAEQGHLDVLKWARENECPWNELTCAYAANGGHLAVLKWARENGCSWNEWTCAFAAYRGQLEVLKWARANGCPWDNETCAYAAEAGHLVTLKWARENGRPVDREHAPTRGFEGDTSNPEPPTRQTRAREP